MTSHAIAFPLLSIAALMAGAPAQAAPGLTRTFVSSTGSDTNPCTITQPCATFVAAYNAVANNGIIAALDPGKYGSITINRPVTINGNGWAAVTATANGNGITVNTGTGNVILNGIEVDGANSAYNGIVFNSGTSLTISNCQVKDFIVNQNDGATGNGILIAPTQSVNFTIVNTVAFNGQYAGINFTPRSGNPTVNGAIDHVVADNNTVYGIAVNTNGTTGGIENISVSNSVVSSNGDINPPASTVIAPNTIVSPSGAGVYVTTSTDNPLVILDNDEITNNSIGVFSNGANVALSRSVITKNTTTGVEGAGTVATYGDNRIKGNGTPYDTSNVAGTLTPATPQ